jgi:hypothetical protein
MPRHLDPPLAEQEMVYSGGCPYRGSLSPRRRDANLGPRRRDGGARILQAPDVAHTAPSSAALNQRVVRLRCGDFPLITRRVTLGTIIPIQRSPGASGAISRQWAYSQLAFAAGIQPTVTAIGVGAPLPTVRFPPSAVLRPPAVAPCSRDRVGVRSVAFGPGGKPWLPPIALTASTCGASRDTTLTGLPCARESRTQNDLN